MEPMRIDIGRARREAKALLAAARRGDADALARLRTDRPPMLADAQRAVARRHGFPSWPRLVQALDGGGMALRRASQRGDEVAIQSLLEAGAPPNGRDRRTGRTALHLAAAADQLDAVSVLVGWVHVDQMARDRQDRTALDLARPGSAVAAVLTSCQPGPHRPPIGDRHARLADELEVALLGHLAGAEGTMRHPLGDGFIIRTGLHDNSRNGVVCSRLPGEEVAAALADLADVPARWYLPGPTEPADLRDRLVQAGCSAERTAVHMAAPLATVATPDRTAATIEEVTDPEHLPHLDPGEAALLTAAGPPIRHFVIDGVGGASTFRHGDAVLGLHLAVRPGHRRRGLARALVGHAAAAARADGCTTAVLAPTPATVPFFERLGFELERSRPDRWYYLPAP